MDSKLVLYNTLTRRKEVFEPLVPGRVGMYVCGPTVYGDPHLGHARPAVTFDLLFRYLKASGYKVRYVRNITDVGHLEHDADEGEDKIAKKARLEQLEPMEVAHYYTERYHRAMDALNVETPSIEPYASGHIIEQIEFVKRILADGYAYEANGSVYFDVEKYNAKYNYGRLSGRNLDDIVANTRELDGQSDKRHSYDFALWKKASPEHIMRWPSPWGEGFPGWHMECSAMSTRYLGERFDIHGGGMDLMFPHHECEIAQSTAALGHDSARYWLHNNMMTVNGQKMGKSLGNFITLEEFFTGSHPKLSQAYSPMTIRFFVLQAHYRSTLDFSNEALQAAEKGLDRLMKGIETLGKIKPAEVSTVDPAELETLKAFFLDLGFAGLTFSTPEEHDRIIAFTSQLAHITSSAYVKSPEAQKRRGFSAGSFQDMTRVARLDEDMWTELFLDDADYLTGELEVLVGHLTEYLDALKARDADTLRALLRDGREKKATAGGN